MPALHFDSAIPRLAEHAAAIVRRLSEHGFTALFAGGCVRDALRGAPVKDIDIATDATPAQIAALFPAQSIGVGQSFGVMLVLQEGTPFDVATFRTDGGYQDGRHPDSITFDTAEHDAQRRDFTVNALFYDPLAQRVIDYVGGQDDLRAGILRTVGDPLTRFREDRLRLLRAIRFAAVCGWTIHPDTWAAIRAEAHALPCVSPERIRTDFIRTLTESPTPSHALDLLAESGLLATFLPELLTLRGCVQDPRWHPEGDVWTHTARMLDLLPTPRDPTLTWAILLHDIGKPATLVIDRHPDGTPRPRTPNHAAVGARLVEPILRRLKESRAAIDTVTTLVRDHMMLVDLPRMRPANARKLLGRPTIQFDLELHRLDCLASHGKLDLYTLAQEKLAQYAAEPILPPRLITGKDLLALGHTPGPALGRLLEHLYALQLEGTPRDELLALARQTPPKH